MTVQGHVFLPPTVLLSWWNWGFGAVMTILHPYLSRTMKQVALD